jgi:hypothetical protein
VPYSFSLLAVTQARPGREWSPFDIRRISEVMPALTSGDLESLLRFVAEAESLGSDEPSRAICSASSAAWSQPT